MKRLIMGVMVAVLVCAGAYCAWRYYEEAVLPEKRIADADKVQQELFLHIKPKFDKNQPADDTSSESPAAESAENTETAENNAPLAAAAEVNNGTVGWITVPGTYIDYPIAQCGDNYFYLQHGFAGDYNYGLGCPFLDCRCDGDFSGFDSIVYAHHLTGRRMFADIALYKDESFMQSCPTGILTTESGQHTVRFFAYLSVTYNDGIYRVVKDESEREEYLAHLFDAALYTRGITAEKHESLEKENTRLLLLSTCTYETEETRGVLVGVVE